MCLIGLLSVSILVFTYLTVNPLRNDPIGDARSYFAMAENPFIFENYAEAPFCYRILTPLLVHYLPFSTSTNFLIFNSIALILSSMLLYWLLCTLNMSKKLSVIGVLLFLTSWHIQFYYFCRVRVYPLTLALIVLILIFIVRRNTVGFLITITLAALQREAPLCLIPVHFMYNYNKKWSDFKTLLLYVPPFLVFFTIKLCIVPRLEELYPFSYLQTFIFMLMYNLSSVQNVLRIIHSFFYTYNILAIIFFLELNNIYRYLVINKVWVVYIFINTIVVIISGLDIDRFQFYIFPAIIYLSLYGISKNMNFYRQKHIILFLIGVRLFHAKYFSDLPQDYFITTGSLGLPYVVIVSNLLKYLCVFLLLYMLSPYSKGKLNILKTSLARLRNNPQ